MFDILYEDECLIVVDKPAGMPVQTASLMQKDMVSELKNYRAKKGEDTYIGLVNRLDQPVSGVIVFAKDKATADFISAQIRDKKVKKEYIARVMKNGPDGSMSTGDTGEYENYLIKDGKNNMSRVVNNKSREAKLARLSYKVLDTDDETATVRIMLDTGRHHQIRVQFSHAGHPLAGDKKYGDEKAKNITKSLCLGCVLFSFVHPKTKKEMVFETRPEFLDT